MRKYEIDLIPEKTSEFSQMCITKIGRRSTFCVQSNCNIKHSREVLEIQLGDIYVAKSKKRVAFCKPILDGKMVGSTLLSKMLTPSMTLDEWHVKFTQVQDCYQVMKEELGVENTI